MSLRGKKVLLGVCGGIAAYKSAYLVRLLTKAGAEVRVMMTPDAAAFVGPLTFATLSKHPVAIDFFDKQTGQWQNHVSTGLWPDVILIAPITANTIAKLAGGITDNFLLATTLSSRCPIYLAPAMDLDMWKYQATVDNIAKLKGFGHHIINPVHGELASGLEGTGRMAEPEELLEVMENHFQQVKGPLSGKKVLITAGPTYEAIDPVRFIGNHSTGKMGIALAETCLRLGAEVTLVHGPMQVSCDDADIHSIAVTSAAEMLGACEEAFPTCDIFIAAAAVADFTPEAPSAQKIKKGDSQDGSMQLNLRRTTDILGTLSAKKGTRFVVGFALETSNGLEYAKSKLEQKNLDMVVLNTTADRGAGFGHDTNKITLLDKSGEVINFELKSKAAVAQDIVQHIIRRLHA